MRDEHLDTILTIESDEFIKSSVENLVPNPSESEGENGCDVPACFTTFSNVLFDAEYEFDSVDDQSLSDEDFQEEIFLNPLFEVEIIPMKIDQHHFNAESDLIESLLNRDYFIISSSSKIDSLLDEFAGKLTLLKSILPGIDETDRDPEEDIHLIERLLYDNSSPRPPEEFVSENSNANIESFSPSPIPIEDSDSRMEEIDLTFTPDILIHEELLDNYSLSLPENESFHFDIPLFSRTPAKPPDGNTGILNIKMMGDNSEQKVPIPGLTITRVSNQEKSPDLLSHWGLENFQLSAKCPMMIHGTFSNVLFDAEYEFDSVDDQSLSDEDFQEEIFLNPLFEVEIIPMKIDQHHFNAESDLIESLLNRDYFIISSSSKIDSLLDEFAGKLTLLKSILPGIDETDRDPEEDIHLIERLLYDNSSPRPPEEFDSDSRMEEIDLTFTPDILIHEELLDNYSLSLPENESFHFDIPLFSRTPAKPPDGNTGILNIKMMGDNSEQKVPIPGLTITRVANQEKSPDLLSHWRLENFQLSAKCPMMIHGKNIPILDVPLFHFIPLDQLKSGGN
uniref:Uncharacterized protein n=1 Tax=Tanacetum cinerariifolium TaxID=118510 RepID=A0A6L2JMM5_TANCI|nr:hypothetical protein [Tanacetum cinerariifolium]